MTDHIFRYCLPYQYREDGECFLEECPGNKRDKPTLLEIIKRRVRPGTRILTDGWAAYNGLDREGNLYSSFLVLPTFWMLLIRLHLLS